MGSLFQYPVQLDPLKVVIICFQGDKYQAVHSLFEMYQTSVFLEKIVAWESDKLEIEVSNIFPALLPV